MSTGITFEQIFCLLHFLYTLQVCIAARLCQSLVLGAYSHTMDPNNEYLLNSQANGWKMLDKLWPTSAKELDELWFDTADNYLKRSEK